MNDALLQAADVRFILASASPRRRQLLAQAGIGHEVMPAAGEESSSAHNPADYVQELSAHKAREVEMRLRGFRPDDSYQDHQDQNREIAGSSHSADVFDMSDSEEARAVLPVDSREICVIGADTVVVCDGQILGKPKDRDDAVRMIRLLQGRDHQVMTGVTVILNGQQESFCEMTDVHVYPMTEEEIAAYVATGEPDDKAGAYGIQGAFGVYIRGIDGDYNNVVGLPIARLYHVLSRKICFH